MSSETHVTRRYEQQLARAIGVLGNICITVSGITPTASILSSHRSPLPIRGVELFWLL